jgi:endonuclease YncB( thermonuclease family)
MKNKLLKCLVLTLAAGLGLLAPPAKATEDATEPGLVVSVRAERHARPEQVLIGRVSVIDGDTLELHGVRIRLQAIDAPEARQNCHHGDQLWPCGRRAAYALADLIGTRTVTCRWRETDRYRRPVALCETGGADVGAWMVEQGWALAFRRYGETYIPLEDEARAKRRGLWAGSFVPPWDHRKGHEDEVSAETYAGS